MLNLLVAGAGCVTGINVIKSLLNQSINIVGVDCEKNAPAGKFCKIIQISKCSDLNYKTDILRVIDNYNITHIIACNDHDVRAITVLFNGGVISSSVKFNGYSSTTLGCLDKKETYNLFEKHSILTPQIVYDDYDFPYVLRIESMGLTKKFVHIVKGVDDLNLIAEEELTTGIKTRYIRGVEFTVDVIADKNSNVLYAVPRKRVHVVNGMVHHSIIVKDLELIEKIKVIVKKLDIVGVICIQCIKSDIDNEYYFIEVNPRPGSGIDLSIEGNINMPLIWMLENVIKMDNVEPEWGLQMKRYYEGYFYK